MDEVNKKVDQLKSQIIRDVYIKIWDETQDVKALQRARYHDSGKDAESIKRLREELGELSKSVVQCLDTLNELDLSVVELHVTNTSLKRIKLLMDETTRIK